MDVKVTNAYGNQGSRHFKGSPDEIRAQLLVAYPWLEKHGRLDFEQTLARLGSAQALIVNVED